MSFQRLYRRVFPESSDDNPDGKPSMAVRLLVMLTLGVASWVVLIGILMLITTKR